MKLEQAQNTIQGNMQGEKVKMGVQMDDMSHIMGILTDLYKDRLLAVIREYSTNALDAHVEAGVSLPIEITLPTALSPFLKIRDYGVGLDRDGIVEVYSQYGRSTKRGTNEQTGMLGLGCKSALTYTQQFTITSVKDGQRVVVMVSRDEDGAGHMQIVSDEATDAANGTEVMVAIQRPDMQRAADIAAKLFSFWQPGTVTVNGRQPERFDANEQVLKLTDNLYMDKSREFTDDVVVMGGVSYSHRLDVGINRGYGVSNFAIIAFVPIGSVKPTPSRESLMDTTLTKTTLAGLKVDFQAAIEGAIQREIDKAATATEAIRVIIAWSNLIPRNSAQLKPYTYKGNALPAGYEVGEDDEPFITSGSRASKLSESYSRKKLPISDFPTAVWVENYKPTVFTAQHKKKLNKWATDSGLTMPVYRYGNAPGPSTDVGIYVMLGGKAPKSPFIDASTRVVDWETVRAIRIEPKPRYKGGGVYAPRVSGSFDIITETGTHYEIAGDKIRQDKPILWVHGNTSHGSIYRDALKGIYKEFTLVCLPGNRITKFCREVPKALKVLDAVKAGYDAWKKALKADDLLAMALHDYDVVSTYNRFDAAKVDDPEVKEMIRLATRNVDAVMRQRRAMQRLVARHDTLPAPNNPMAKYPLVQGRYYKPDAHAYFYMNAAYAAMQSGSL